ncbi:MAG: antitoxin [Ruminococcus sp.]|nr:antitoxin [Ruminococcus sp.]
MPKAETRAKNKYNAKAYDRIALQVKKGQRDIIRKHAEAQGLSLNGYINKLIAKDMGKQG